MTNVSESVTTVEAPSASKPRRRRGVQTLKASNTTQGSLTQDNFSAIAKLLLLVLTSKEALPLTLARALLSYYGSRADDAANAP